MTGNGDLSFLYSADDCASFFTGVGTTGKFTLGNILLKLSEAVLELIFEDNLAPF